MGSVHAIRTALDSDAAAVAPPQRACLRGIAGRSASLAPKHGRHRTES